MKTSYMISKKISLLLVAIMLSGASAFGATFTALTSGSWSSSATWGGAVPPYAITNDMVIIPVGVNVMMDNDVSVNGALASIQVIGALSAAANTSLSVSSFGSITGTGTISVGNIILSSDAAVAFTGSVVADTITTTALSLQLVADVLVNQALNLMAGTLSIGPGGILNVGNNGTIVISGGLLSLNGGTVGLSGMYNVTYLAGSATAGVELTGSGLNNVTVDVSSGNTVTLTSDLFVDGTLSLTSGSLALNGNNLTITGDVASGGTGTVSSTITGSDITVSVSGGTTGSLNFSGGTNMVNTLTINAVNTSQVQIGGSLAVNSALQLTGGVLNFSDATLTINGTVSGPGYLSGNASSNLVINTTGGLANSLHFLSGGRMINNLSLDIGAGNTVTLGTDLTLAGALSLSNGSTLNISGVTLTIVGNIIGWGSFVVNSGTGLTIGGGNAHTSIFLSGSSIGNLTVDVGSGNVLTLESDLIVSGLLTLQSGQLFLNGHDFTITSTGDVSASGSGGINSEAPSNISINASAGTTGTLNFIASGVNSLNINVGSGNQTHISGYFVVRGPLNLNSGTLNFSGGSLFIYDVLNGSGFFSADTSANLVINNLSGLSHPISFIDGGQTVNTLTVNVGTGNSVTLGSDLTVTGTLSITGGSILNFNGQALTVAGNLIGPVTFIANASSTLIVTTPGGISIPITISGGILGTLVVSTGNGNGILLGDDLTITAMLDMQSGVLTLNDYDLIISGDVAAGGTGSISSTAVSNITVNRIGGVAGTLNFSGTGNAVNNLTINVGAGNQSHIGGSLSIDGSLLLTSGTLTFYNTDLTINGDISGVGSLSGNTSSNLAINTVGGIAGPISFASGGQAVNNFTLNVDSGNSVTLGSNLTMNGTLDLINGSVLNFTGQGLTIEGDLNGTGTFAADASSSLIINTNGGISTPINIPGGNIGTLIINVGVGNTVMLGSDLTVSGSFDMQSGTLVLNGYDLEISGDIAVGGTGIISSTATSNVTVSGSFSPSGALRFSAGAVVGNFTVNLNSGGSVAISSDLEVDGTLNFMAGSVNIGSYGLDIGTGGSISGAGSSSYVITGINGYLGMRLNAGSSSASVFPVGTTINHSPAYIRLNASSPSGRVQVGVSENVLAEGTTGSDISGNQPLVDATWHVASDITSNLSLNLEVRWSTTMEVNAFNRTAAYISHYGGGNWDAAATASATAQSGGMFSLQRNNITSLSPFAVFDENTITRVAEITNPDVQFEVYPNPASDHILVQNSMATTDVLNVDITNVIGQVVGSYKMTNAAVDIPLSGLFKGNYFIRLYNDRMNVVKKFTKM